MQDKNEKRLVQMIGHINAARRIAKNIYSDLYQFNFDGPWDVDHYLDGLGPDCTKKPIENLKPRNDDEGAW